MSVAFVKPIGFLPSGFELSGPVNPALFILAKQTDLAQASGWLALRLG